MRSPTLEWREVFTGRVRAIQAAYPQAHRALKNWGVWSRDLRGVFPRISRQALWDGIDTSSYEGYAVDDGSVRVTVRQFDVKAERQEEHPMDEKEAELVDGSIHAKAFPAVWRKALRAAYYTRSLPEYQFPVESRCGAELYLQHLEFSLAHIEKLLLSK